MRALLVAAILALAVATAGVPTAAGPDVPDRLEPLLHFIPLVDDPSRADSAFTELGRAIPSLSDSAAIGFAYFLRYSAAKTLDRPDTMIAQADSSARFLPEDPSAALDLGIYLTRRRMRLDVAESCLGRGLAALERFGHSGSLDYHRAWLGHVQMLRGRTAEAIESFEQALAGGGAPRDWVQLNLGKAYARTGRSQRAIDALIEAAASPSADTSDVREAEALLDTLVRARDGSSAALSGRLASARREGLRKFNFDSRRDGRAWTNPRLFDVRDSTMRTLDLSRGVAVVDFWGTWCAPCVTALPQLEASFQTPRPKPVRFVTIAVEGVEPERARSRIVRVLDENRVTIPAFAADSALVEQYGIRLYPTTMVVRDGRVLYRIEGLAPGVLEAELESLGCGAGPAARERRSR